MLAAEVDSPLTFKKIMYATDFSPVAETAGSYAMMLAHRFGSILEIAHVFQPDVFSQCEVSGEPSGEEDQRRSHQGNIVRLQNKFFDAGIMTCSRISSEYPVWTGLLLLAAEEAPDLLVLGTQSKSGFDRLTIGSTAEHMIRMTTIPILTVGPGVHVLNEGLVALRIVLIATDFSPPSIRAARYGAALAEATGARLHLLQVEVDLNRPLNDATHSLDRLCADLRPLMSEGSEILCNSENAASDTHISETITRFADRIQADLIVLGARKGAFWLTRFERGVTVNVLAKARCPVLTVCRPIDTKR